MTYEGITLHQLPVLWLDCCEVIVDDTEHVVGLLNSLVEVIIDVYLTDRQIPCVLLSSSFCDRDTSQKPLQ